MISIPSLWMPIILSAIAVFIVSSIVHMALSYHRSDFSRLPDEEKIMEGMRDAKVTPGGYFFPYAASPNDMGTPEMQEKFKNGPVGMLTVMPNGPPMMPKHLVMWFLYCLVMSIFLAYLAGRTLAVGAPAMQVFRFVGTAGFLGYAMAHGADPIWRGQSWSVTLKNMFDGLIYGAATAGVFAWLWP